MLYRLIEDDDKLSSSEESDDIRLLALWDLESEDRMQRAFPSLEVTTANFLLEQEASL